MLFKTTKIRWGETSYGISLTCHLITGTKRRTARHKNALKYLIEELNYPMKNIKRISLEQGILFYAAEFSYTSVESFEYLHDFYPEAKDLIEKTNEKGENIADVASNYGNEKLYRVSRNSLRTLPVNFCIENLCRINRKYKVLS